uniref:MULE transposase domain-containing protein n=1 Tax=Ditylenchus dipsaci TaxID=166011 RepID=A0A915CRM4_9BILA
MQGLELVIDEYESPKRGKATKFKQLDVYESEDLFMLGAAQNWLIGNCEYTENIVEQSYGVHEHKSKKPVVLNEIVKKIVREDKTLSAMQMQDRFRPANVRLDPHLHFRVLSSSKTSSIATKSKSHLPEDCNEPFVVKFDTRVADETEQFCLVWSTRRLLELQKHSRMLQVDGTYKTNWLGFPVLLSGFSDSNGKFFATFMALVSSETTWSYKCFLSAISNLGYAPELVMGDGDSKFLQLLKDLGICSPCYVLCPCDA